MILGIAAILFVISFLWALASLKRELGRPREVEHARSDLKREKVLYRAH